MNFILTQFLLHYHLACNCHAQGSVSSACDSNGVCKCYTNVIGNKCTSCMPGYFGFPNCKGMKF